MLRNHKIISQHVLCPVPILMFVAGPRAHKCGGHRSVWNLHRTPRHSGRAQNTGTAYTTEKSFINQLVHLCNYTRGNEVLPELFHKGSDSYILGVK